MIVAERNWLAIVAQSLDTALLLLDTLGRLDDLGIIGPTPEQIAGAKALVADSEALMCKVVTAYLKAL